MLVEPHRLQALFTLALIAVATSCGPPPQPISSDSESSSEVRPSVEDHAIDAACAASPPTDGMACNGDGYCVRPPTADADGAHCYCKDGQASCSPVLAQPLSGPCSPQAATKEVLVYEDGVVIGFNCMCVTTWMCEGPPPG